MIENLLALVVLSLFPGTRPNSAQAQGTSLQSQTSLSSVSDQSSSDAFVLEVASKVNATYPPAALLNKSESVVLVKVVISETGEVESADIVTGSANLAESALDAAKQWKFKTWKHKVYLPLRAWAQISFDFNLKTEKRENSARSASQAPLVEGTVVQSGELPRIPTLSPVLAGRMLIHRVAPTYPPEARAARVEGAVVLVAIIGKKGEIDHVNVLSGDAILVDAAVAAVKQWRYHPYVLNAGPVEVSTQITVNFTLSGP